VKRGKISGFGGEDLEKNPQGEEQKPHVDNAVGKAWRITPPSKMQGKKKESGEPVGIWDSKPKGGKGEKKNWGGWGSGDRVKPQNLGIMN